MSANHVTTGSPRPRIGVMFDRDRAPEELAAFAAGAEAFDIAGQNVADHRNLLEAVRVAAEVAQGGRATQRRGLGAAFGRAA